MKSLIPPSWRALQKPTPFALFMWLWVGGMILHMIDRFWRPLLVDELYGLLIGIIFLIFPSVDWFLWMVFAQVLSGVLRMPILENHWLFATLVNIALLCTMLTPFFRGTLRTESQQQELFSQITPLLRILVVLLYFFAVFHKLNWDFFDPEVSCVTFYYKQFAGLPLFPALPAIASGMGAYLLIVFVLLIEIAVVVLLAYPRTWFSGIVIGVLLHQIVSPTMRDFPLLMYALYIVFIPQPVLRQLIDTAEKCIKRITDGCLTLFSLWRIVLLVSIVYTAFAYMHDEYTDLMLQLGFRKWTIAVLIVLVWFMYHVLKNGYHRVIDKDCYTIRPRWLWIFPILFALNCLQPYIGLRTTVTVSMFSNLRTEGEQVNHMFIPKMPLFEYQDDLVEILQTSDRHLEKEYAEKDKLITWHMLRRHIRFLSSQGEKDIFLKYKRDGNIVTLEHAEADSRLTKPESGWQQFLLEFRPVDVGEKNLCAW